MKNSTIITVAALLAAGTALANAATEWTYVGSDGNWATASNWQLSDGSTATSAPAGVAGTNGNDRNIVNIGDNNTVTGNFTDKKTTYSLIVNIGTGSTLDFSLLDTKIANSTFNIDGLLKFSNNVWLAMPNSGNLGGHSATTPVFNLGDTGSVVYTGDINNADTANLSLTGTFDSASETLGIQTRTLLSSTGTGTKSTFDSLLSATAFSFSFTNTASTGATKLTTGLQESALTVDDIGKYWLSYAADKKSVILNYVVGTIPEPSAFGLLAGLGALALAGTRRRRRK